MKRRPYQSIGLLFCTILLLCTGVKGAVNEDEILQNQDPLYVGDSVIELLKLCKHLKPSDLTETVVHGKKAKECPPEEFCIPNCNEERLNKLRYAQERVEDMANQLTGFHRIFWPLLAFCTVFCQGTYLIVVKQFNWRTLFFIPGHEFEHDPTDGYRYHHYMWMGWVILESSHPMYYKGMTPDTHELEYIPQNKEWEDPEAESEAEIFHSWSVRDILDMTADPHERLEVYFRRVQQNYQVNKPPGHMRKFRKKKH